MSQIHDNRILSYTVDFEKSELVINTDYFCNEIHEMTNIIFTNYLVHHFENEQQGSIIFDIEKYDISRFIEGNGDLIKEKKHYGWPFIYESKKELVEKLTMSGYSYYVIDSSCGLYGWVLAKGFEIIIHAFTV